MHTFTETETAALREAVKNLDALWELDAERGMRDGQGGAEYWRLSPAARLRELLGEVDPFATMRQRPHTPTTP